MCIRILIILHISYTKKIPVFRLHCTKFQLCLLPKKGILNVSFKVHAKFVPTIVATDVPKFFPCRALFKAFRIILNLIIVVRANGEIFY